MSGSPPVRVRDARPEDADACAAIYAPYVLETAVSFETVPPSAEQIAQRMAEAQRSHAWLVAEREQLVVGYAYGHPFSARAAYRWSCETSVYVGGDVRGAGIGRSLYTALLDRLAGRGYRTALAGMTLPNEASAGLHRALGYQDCGTYRRVGWKNGTWHDVHWMQTSIGPLDGPPSEPV